MALVLVGLPALAHAQSVNTWSLPEPEATTTAGAQGPIDAQNPIVRPAAPEAGSTATPSAGAIPSPAPTITPLPVITPSTTPRVSASSAPTAAPIPAPGASARPQSATSPQVTAPTTAASPAAAPTGSQSPAVRISEPASPQSSATEKTDGAWPEWWWAIPDAIVVAALVLGLFLLRRRRALTGEWEEEGPSESETDAAPHAPAPEPEALPAPAAVAPLLPLPTPNFTPPPAPAASHDAITVTFEPVAMRLSLFYATLQYRISLTARAAHAPLKLVGDLISAHASLSQDEQLAPSPDALPRLHALPGLAPGETVELKGEIQLPLPEIRAMRKGGASFFVPLVRCCVIGEDGTAQRRVFTLGLPGGGAGLAPLRIDTGPRNFEPLAAREIEMARQLPLQTGVLPLDPQRAAS